MPGADESAAGTRAPEPSRPPVRGPVSREWTLSSRAPLAVLITALIMTGIVVAGVARLLRARDEARFENAVRDVEDRIRARVDAYVGTLQDAAALFAARRGEISREEFSVYVQRSGLYRRYPGIEGVGFSKRLPADERAAFVQAVRATGLESFDVWPAAQASAYFPVVYLEPPGARNLAAIGFDMYSEPVRRAAMERAWATGSAALSGKVLLKQEIERHKQAGFLLYVPVYRGGDVPATERERKRALIGFVYAPFRADDFFDGIFGKEVRPRVAFSVYDGSRAQADWLLHDSSVRGVVADAPRLSRTTALSVGGRSWTLRTASLPLVDATPDPLVPGLALGGLVLSLVLFALARSQARAREQSELRARETQEASKLLDSERARLSSLFMAAPASIAMTRGPEHVYVLSNPINNSWIGNKPVLGKPVRAAYPEGAADDFFALLDRVYQSGEPFRATESPMRVVRPDGSTEKLFINVVYQPTRDREGSVDGIAGFAFDVTAQVVARHKAEEAVQARDIFLTVASHELKTPLTALSLRLSQLRREMDGGGAGASGRQLRHLDTAESQVKKLSQLVDMLLDVSHLTAGKLSLSLKEGDLAEIVRETVQVMRPQALKAGCELRLESNESVHGMFDELRIAQVVTNLLSNSIKFGAGHPIHVTLCDVAGRAQLIVRDEGIGIASEDLGRIFSRFERAVSSRNYGGLGLGLWVTREIVEAMGGSVSASSAPGEGATFVVELPPASAVPQA